MPAESGWGTEGPLGKATFVPRCDPNEEGARPGRVERDESIPGPWVAGSGDGWVVLESWWAGRKAMGVVVQDLCGSHVTHGFPAQETESAVHNARDAGITE